VASAWQSTFAAQPWSGRMPPASATIAAQFWAEAAPWRMTAGWVMVAALLASGWLNDWRSQNWQAIVLLWLLVDPLWGALWRLAGGRPQLLALKAAPSADEPQLRLPYMRDGSPAAQLMRLDENDSIPYLVRVAVPTLGLALIVAATLGLPALIFSGLAALLAVGGWTLRRTRALPPLLLHAAAMIVLPWLLVTLQAGVTAQDARWSAILWLSIFWTLHAWAEGRATLWPADKIAPWLFGTAQIGVLIVLILNRVPFWVPLTAVLLLPTWLRLLRRQPLAGPGGLAPWWLAAMMSSALALGWQ
jgi:hypothetical protein